MYSLNRHAGFAENRLLSNMLCVFSGCIRPVRDSCQSQKLFIRLNALRQKPAVPEQRIGRDRRRHVLCGFFVGNVDNLERNAVLFGRLLHPRHPIVGERTLVGVIQNKAALLDRRMCCYLLTALIKAIRRLCSPK